MFTDADNGWPHSALRYHKLIPLPRLQSASGRDYLYFTFGHFYARKQLSQLLLSARLSRRNSVCPSVTRVDQSKTVQDGITKSSPSAAWKTLVSATAINLKGVTSNEGTK